MEDKELAELEKQIEAKQDEVKPEPVAVAPTPEPTPAPAPEPQAAPSASTPEPEFNASEWVQKKGWKKAEDAAESMRQLEKQFHEKSEELARIKAQQTPSWQGGYTPPVNPYAPPAPMYQPPAYIPPAPSYGYPSQGPTRERVAASYNMHVEDFDRVLALARDAAAIEAQKVDQEYRRKFAELAQSTEKSQDMTNVMADPAFRNPNVQKEMYEIFDKNPTMFTQPRAYSLALKEALANIGRRNMTWSEAQGQSLPTEPPRTAGSGAASGSTGPGRRNFGGLPSQREMEGKSTEELEKLLKGAGAFKTYADLT